MAERFVAYYRVSTDKQGRSGLGLQSQRDMIARVVGPDDQMVAEFIEVETGKGYNALHRRPVTGAKVRAVRLCSVRRRIRGGWARSG